MAKKLPELSGFTGTENYHKFNPFCKLVATDGIIYMARELGAFWLLDIVASVQKVRKVLLNNRFIIWRIVVKDNKAIFSGYTDCEENGSYSKDKEVYSQKIKYTDFPEGEFEFYQQGEVILLKEEH